MEDEIMSIAWAEVYASGLAYEPFLEKYGTDAQRERWAAKRATLSLSPEQKSLLANFSRKVHILCMAGAWCGDCVDQCPMLAEFEAACPLLEVRFVDRDECDPAFKESVKVCGGNRVPVVVFLNEDFQPTGTYGDRTLAKYRHMMEKLTGAACSTGISLGDTAQMDALTTAVMQEWLDQLERNHAIMRTSTRLREKHND